MNVLNLQISMELKNSFFQTSKNDMTMSLQLMTNRQNEHAYLPEGRSLTFFSLHRLIAQ